jgi:hypothetical protein
MRIGFSLFNNWGIKDVQCIVQLASWAEALGFDLVWVHDYVFNAGHVFDRIGGKPYYEPLTLLPQGESRMGRLHPPVGSVGGPSVGARACGEQSPAADCTQPPLHSGFQ